MRQENNVTTEIQTTQTPVVIHASSHTAETEGCERVPTRAKNATTVTRSAMTVAQPSAKLKSAEMELYKQTNNVMAMQMLAPVCMQPAGRTANAENAQAIHTAVTMTHALRMYASDINAKIPIMASAAIQTRNARMWTPFVTSASDVTPDKPADAIQHL